MKLSPQFVTFIPASKSAATTDQVGKTEARKQLVEIAATLVKGDTVKSGFLRLHGSQDKPELGHGRWSSGYTAASRLVSDLVGKAYGTDSQVARDLQTYLQGRDKVGVKSFLKLVKAMEKDSLVAGSPLQRLQTARLGGRIQLNAPAATRAPQEKTLEERTVQGRTYQLEPGAYHSGADGVVMMARASDDPMQTACLKIDKPGQHGTTVEHQVLARLRARGGPHPHIVREFGHDAAAGILVLERCKGSMLQDTQGPVQAGNLALRAAWFGQTRQAMELLHDADIVHRDLNTKNVLIREDGTAALADFGNAHDFEYSKQPCPDLFGVPQTRDEAKSADRRDLLKLGYNLLAGTDKAPPNPMSSAAVQTLLQGLLPPAELQGLAHQVAQALQTYHDRSASPQATERAVASLGQAFERLRQPAAAAQVQVPVGSAAPRGAPGPVLAHQAMDPDQVLNLGALSLRGAPPAIKPGLDQELGALTPDLMNWLIASGQLRPALDPDAHHYEVTALPRSGASTMGLMMLKVDGRNAFILKECGNRVEIDGQLQHFNYYQDADTGNWMSNAFEDQKLEQVQDSALGRMGTLTAPNGARFGLGQAQATFRYRPEQRVTILTDRGERTGQAVMHQINLLHVAPGRELGEVLGEARQSPDQARQAAADMGSALGAFHRRHADLARTEDTGGLRTLVHGDFHPGNLFYEPETRTLTAIDTAGAAANFREKVDDVNHDGIPRAWAYRPRNPPGHDMLMDVKRALDMSDDFKNGPPELRKGFLQAYADNFKDLIDAQGQPRYSVDKLERLIANPKLGAALT